MRLRTVAPRGALFPLTWLVGLLMMASGLVVSAAPAASAGPAQAKANVGWIRLAHLSPNTPPVDVYLYSFGNPHAMIVLKHVAYGAVSPYEKVKTGQYTVAMRAADAKAGSPPVVSTNVQIAAGGAYTVAGMGPAKGLRLQVLRDRLTTPRGKALVRVIQASLRDHRVRVTAGGQVLAASLSFAHVTSYVTTRAGTLLVRAKGPAASTSESVLLPAGTIHTLVVLDTSNGLKLASIEDAAGSAVAPQGGAATGLGGTAPVSGPSPLAWLGVVGAGTLCLCAGAYGLRRVKTAPRHAR